MTPPKDAEIELLTAAVEEAQEQNLEPAEIETRLRGTRIWHWLKVIAKNDVRIATDPIWLLMIIDTLLTFSFSATSAARSSGDGTGLGSPARQ